MTASCIDRKWMRGDARDHARKFPADPPNFLDYQGAMPFAARCFDRLVHRFHETNMLGRDSHDATVYGIATPGPISQVVAWPRFGKWWNCQ